MINAVLDTLSLNSCGTSKRGGPFTILVSVHLRVINNMSDSHLHIIFI